jgi:hypothetical protein
MPADAVFTLKVMKFNAYNAGKGDCPYQIIPPPGSKQIFEKHSNGHIYPTWICGNGVDLHVGHYQKPFTFAKPDRIPTTIRMTLPNAILRFDIVDENGKPEVYYPMGIGFFRADETKPMGSPFTTGKLSRKVVVPGTNQESPFFNVTFNDPPGTIEFEVERIAKLASKGIKEHRSGKDHSKTKGTGTHRTYALIVCVQDLETGQLGVFDSPELEPPI